MFTRVGKLFDLAFRPFMILIPIFGLLVGFVLQLFGYGLWSNWIWAAGSLPVLLVLLLEITSSLRRGDVGLDIVAALSMSAAIVFGEELAAAVVALMYAGGHYLEQFAERHARREMTALLTRVPRTVLRHRNNLLEDVDLETVTPGDRLLVRRGDVVPVDGTVESGVAVLDQSALTGESLPVERNPNDTIMSGSTNVGDAFDLLVSKRAAESTYAGIVRLVDAAQRSKAPMSRLADKFALVFLAVAVSIAGAAWFWTWDPIRAVAVLVVATPCPLILAVPVAIVSGLSRSAKQGILIKGGKVLEAIARIRSLVIDKTGTLTHGRAQVVSVLTQGHFSANEVMRIAASLDQASKHIIAQAVVSAARDRNLPLVVPTHVVETPGEGIEGFVEGQPTIVGGIHFVSSKLAASLKELRYRHDKPGAAVVAVAIGGRPAGLIVLADQLRAGTQALLNTLKKLGVQRITLATGDLKEVAESIASELSISAIRSELTPDQKVMVVLSERKYGPVMMIGDGVNDAPALAAADVGVAMGARGAAASAEAADVVLLVDQLDRIVPAIKIASRSRFIALESVISGIGLSIAGMIAAALGYMTPVEGAIFQEVIDVVVIMNALRALGG